MFYQEDAARLFGDLERGLREIMGSRKLSQQWEDR